MFLKWRFERAKKKMHACGDALVMLEKEPYTAPYGEAIQNSVSKLKAKLNNLTWKYMRLKLAMPVEAEDINVAIVEPADEPPDYPSVVLYDEEDVEPDIYLPPYLERIYTIISDLKTRIDNMEHKEVTLRDLDEAMRGETAKNDPGLHGDLALLLHRLRDPINHPVSLVELAESIACGECQDPRLVASAIDMMVDDYREGMGPRKSFETSDKGCLEAMDIERNTIC